MSVLILRSTILLPGGRLIISVTPSSKIFSGIFLRFSVGAAEKKRPRCRLLPDILASFGHFCVSSTWSHASFVKSPSPLNTRKPLTRQSGRLSSQKYRRSVKICRFQLAASS